MNGIEGGFCRRSGAPRNMDQAMGVHRLIECAHPQDERELGRNIHATQLPNTPHDDCPRSNTGNPEGVTNRAKSPIQSKYLNTNDSKAENDTIHQESGRPRKCPYKLIPLRPHQAKKSSYCRMVLDRVQTESLRLR